MKSKYAFVVFIWVAACKPATQSTNFSSDATRQAAHEIMLTGTCTLVTVDDNTHPFARVMDPLDPDENFEVWLATNSRSRKLLHIAANPNVVLHYVDQFDNGYVSLYGTAELIRDSAIITQRWKKEWDPFYPNRSTDCVLIKIKPVRLEVINYKAGITGDSVTWRPAVVTF